MPILDHRLFEFFSYSPDQTRRLGIHLGRYLSVGDLVCLEGNLGSGKTTLVQGIAQGWGAFDPVTSPTYVIVNEYRRADEQRMYHLDAYRLSDTWDADILDFDRMSAQGPVVIEWPERIKESLPEHCLWVKLTFTGMERRAMLLIPSGKHYESIVEKIRKKIYGEF
jgi:tRNA threonylcarbamoyladenosine biosynthesis protein TsaE